MFNIRISVLAGCAAFLLSLLIGLISGSSFPIVIVRPVIFGILFFGLPFFFSLLINRFLPELLEENDKAPDIVLPGSRINITEESPAAMPGNIYARPDDTEGGLGNISDALNTAPAPEAPDHHEKPAVPGLDQDGENGYTDQKQGIAPVKEGGYDILPDLESLAGAFMPSAGDKETETYDYQENDPPKRPVMGNKSQKMDVDFSPKDLAAGIRTILEKQEG
ncbi:MAG: hypothetical protein FWF22_03990 [Treponema sp.]|nr:hypothetical protein [Treponema sp.]